MTVPVRKYEPPVNRRSRPKEAYSKSCQDRKVKSRRKKPRGSSAVTKHLGVESDMVPGTEGLSGSLQDKLLQDQTLDSNNTEHIKEEPYTAANSWGNPIPNVSEDSFLFSAADNSQNLSWDLSWDPEPYPFKNFEGSGPQGPNG